MNTILYYILYTIYLLCFTLYYILYAICYILYKPEGGRSIQGRLKRFRPAPQIKRALVLDGVISQIARNFPKPEADT